MYNPADEASSIRMNMTLLYTSRRHNSQTKRLNQKSTSLRVQTKFHTICLQMSRNFANIACKLYSFITTNLLNISNMYNFSISPASYKN